MTQWYYRRMGETVGPISWRDLEQKAREGEIGFDTEVREGTGGPWIAAAHVPRLLDLLADFSPAADPSADGPPAGEAPSAGDAPSAAGASPAQGAEVNVAVAGEGIAEQSRPTKSDIRRSPLNLRPCSDCGTMVSKQASACPKCGRAFHESSFQARYGGEQPVVIFALILLLAAAFLFLSPVAVYLAAVSLAPSIVAAGEAQDVAYTAFGLGVVGVYVFAMLGCTFLGGAVGRPRMAYVTGCLLGLFFGPLGVFAASAIDKRPQCPQCASRLDGLAPECGHCHARLIWKVVPTWY